MGVPFGLWVGVIGANVAIAGAVIVGTMKAGRNADGRAEPIAWALLAWLAVAIGLAGLGVFETNVHTGAPVIGVGIVVPVLAGLWLLRPSGPRGELVDAAPLSWFIGVQVYRVVGALFLVAWAMDLMPWQFAAPAGIGDVLVGVAAPVVARRIARRPDRSRGLAIAWITLGLADLVVAVGTGFLTAPSPFQRLAIGHANSLIAQLPFAVIPLFAVPLSVLLHLGALHQMRHSRTEATVYKSPERVHYVPNPL